MKRVLLLVRHFTRDGCAAAVVKSGDILQRLQVREQIRGLDLVKVEMRIRGRAIRRGKCEKYVKEVKSEPRRKEEER